MIYILVVVVLFFLDNKIKKYIEEHKEMYKKEEILNGNIILERYHNKGAMLNFMENNVSLVKKVTISLLGLLIVSFALLLSKKGNNLLKLGLSFVLGGALSNVYDRVKKGYVVDYFSFKFIKKVVFNISDICIFIGSFLIAIFSLLKNK
jgi:signal peptidase II